MAGYSKLYVVGGRGGFDGADGVNPIDLVILVGESDRQWLEARYFNEAMAPLGNIKVIVPAGPDRPDSLLDACIAFCPDHFRGCPALADVRAELGETERMDAHLHPRGMPPSWRRLREEARPAFARMNIWKANLVPVRTRRRFHAATGGPKRRTHL